jgi:mannose-1-phosphate guanylyltransferase
MIALILAGGKGTRLWPRSNDKTPKHLLNLFPEKSLLRLTYERISPFINNSDIYISTTQEQVKRISDQLPEIPLKNILVEPLPMSTAPCIAFSVTFLIKRYSLDEGLLILPADHYISDNNNFMNSIYSVSSLVKSNQIILFGVTPSYPATGYGYIEVGKKLSNNSFHVKHFKEKPSLGKAIEFIQKGGYYWNSGMFYFSLRTIKNCFLKYQQAMYELIEVVSDCKDQSTALELYKTVKKESFDVSIIEKAENVIVCPVDYEWSDVGNWSSLSDLKMKDADNNYFELNGFAKGSKGNNVYSLKNVALLGVSDLIIVDTDESLLVMHKSLAEYVKDINFD